MKPLICFLLIAAGLGLAACGGGGGDDSPPTPRPDAAEAFTNGVAAIAGSAPETAEPLDTDALSAPGSDTGEPTTIL